MYELIVVAFIGSFISLIEPKAALSKIKLLRKFSAGFCLAVFTGTDAVNLIQQYLNFTISQGGVVFFIAFIGSTFLERVIVIINAVSIRPNWTK